MAQLFAQPKFEGKIECQKQNLAFLIELKVIIRKHKEQENGQKNTIKEKVKE